MNLQTLHSPAARSFGMMQLPAASSSMESVVLRPLTTADDIEAILHLRGQIDLSAHTGAGSNFRSLEKKETN